ncbi:MAG: FAD:protein FMN transferase [Bdellovibrionales bacterium]|nr:FAD:protein FMN transferase [Bdellovibrionales bacterium]
MGTVWTLDFVANDRSVDTRTLQDALMREALAVDRTFSEWSEDSELRQLEKAKLTRANIKASPLFIRGLRLAQDAWNLSDGAFDITVGAVVWKAAAQPVGLGELVWKGDTFSFRKDPLRLTFAGIIKGAAVGELAAKIYKSGVKRFTLSAGGGNVAVAGPTHIEFISRSQSDQHGEQHVFDPSAPTRKLERSTEVTCTSSYNAPETWFHMSGIADALSTALIVKPQLDKLPQNCQANLKQLAK